MARNARERRRAISRSCIFSLRNMFEEKKNSVQRAFVETITRPDVTRRVIGQDNRPMTSISLCHSMNLRVSLNINYYCLFDTFQWPCRKHYVRVCRDNHDNPGLFVEASPDRLSSLSRVTKIDQIDVRYASLMTDSDICVIESIRRTCSNRAKQLYDVKSSYMQFTIIEYVFI